MKSKYAAILVVVVVLVFGIIFLKGPNTNGISDNTIKEPVKNDPVQKNSIQEITLSMKNGNYYPQKININVNEPVRIYLDNTVGGCYRDFTIRELGVAKYIQGPNDYVEFTPTKKGTFGFACSMNMGTGTLIIE